MLRIRCFSFIGNEIAGDLFGRWHYRQSAPFCTGSVSTVAGPRKSVPMVPGSVLSPGLRTHDADPSSGSSLVDFFPPLESPVNAP